MKKTNFIQHNGITVRFVFITPEMAQEMINRSADLFAVSNTKQRRVKQGTVKLYAKDMEKGEWEINGDTITLSLEGKILNGQHRLRSIVKSGVGQWILLVEGVAETAMKTMDMGVKRTLENYLQMMEESYINGSAAIVKIKVMLDDKRKVIDQSSGNISYSMTNLVDAYADNPNMYKEAVHFAKGLNKVDKTFRISEIGGIYLHLTETLKYDKDIVKDFFNMFVTVRRNEKSIFNRTFDNLSKIKQGKERINEYIKCWNAFVKGAKILSAIDENTWFLTPKDYLNKVA